MAAEVRERVDKLLASGSFPDRQGYLRCVRAHAAKLVDHYRSRCKTDSDLQAQVAANVRAEELCGAKRSK